MAAKKGGKAKGRGKRSGASKVAVSKLSNKRLNKLAKQGKLKDRVHKSQYLRLLRERTQGHVDPEVAEQLRQQEKEDVPDIPLSEADYEYFSTPGRDFSFITDVSDGEEEKEPEKGSKKPEKGSKKNKKQEEASDSLEDRYEATSKKKGPATETKSLLPIKTKQGIIPQSREVTRSDDEEENESDQEVEEEAPVKVKLPTLSPADMVVLRERKVVKIRQEIGILASEIVENPEENTRKLRELRNMLHCEDPDIFLTAKKLAIISLTEVFKDIIPIYKIRVISDKEKQQAATKETRKTREFEESLLNNYKNYIDFLEILVKGKAPKGSVHKKRRKKVGSALVPAQAKKPMRKLGLQALCELLLTHTHFNFRTNIIAIVVPYMNNKDEEVRTLVCDYVKKLFKNDRSGEVTLEIVRFIGRVTKACHFDVQSHMLATLLVLKIKEVDRTPQDNKKARKEKMAKLSRRDRKRKKQMEHLEKELEDAAVAEKADNRLRLNTEIINMIFLTYFRILKMGADSHLLSVVLEGLAKFAHLINIDYFDDVFTVLNQLVDTGDLTYRESLHCVQTAFKILSGQGSTLNIDPMRFYRHLYTTLLDIHVGISSEDLPIALESLDLMINKRRKQVSPQRLLAYTKRLTTIALSLGSNGSLAALAMARGFLNADSKMDLLFDTDTLGNGLFTPELDDPEHCHAANTALYELHLLKRFYHPTVRQYAKHLIAGAPSTGRGQLPVDMCYKSAVELHEQYEMAGMTFTPSIPPKARNKQKSLTTTGYIQNEMEQIEEEALNSVSILASFGPKSKKARTNGVQVSMQNGEAAQGLKRKTKSRDIPQKKHKKN